MDRKRWIKEELLLIDAIKYNNEEAHGTQDKLYEKVLGWIAEGDKDAKELSALALKAREIKFTRWYC